MGCAVEQVMACSVEQRGGDMAAAAAAMSSGVAGRGTDRESFMYLRNSSIEIEPKPWCQRVNPLTLPFLDLPLPFHCL